MFKINIDNKDLGNGTKVRNIMDSKKIIARITSENNDMRPSEELDVLADVLIGFNNVSEYTVRHTIKDGSKAEAIIKKDIASLTLNDLLSMVEDVDSSWRWDVFYVNVLKTVITMLQNDKDDIQTPNSYKQLLLSYMVSMRSDEHFYNETDSILTPTVTLMLKTEQDVLNTKIVDLVNLLYTYLGFNPTLIVLLAFKSLLEDAEY